MRVSPFPSLPEKGIPLPPGLRTVTVLIADLDPQVTRDLQGPLEDGGYDVLIARSERRAMQAIYNRQPDLVMLGTRLDGTNGHQVCRRIKSEAALGFLPVIMLADSLYDADTINGDADYSPDAVLVKPVDRSELAMWLQSMVKLKVQYDRKLDRLAREMHRLEILRSELITNISHELGTPLLQVKSAISLLAEVTNTGGTLEQSRLADMATQAVARLEHEVNNIKQLARAHDVRLGPVPIPDAVERALRYLERSWKSREAVARIEYSMDDDLPLVLADKRGLSRLLQVLLDNALKFSPPDEPVYLHVDYDGDDHVWFGVQDAGIGIPAEEHEHIFDAFYKVDASATRRYGGSGTGLALATLLAGGMNIAIDLESEPGVGSMFSFRLPVLDNDGYLNLI